MALTPFHYIPKRRFTLRMLGPAFAVFLIGWMITLDAFVATLKTLGSMPIYCWMGNTVNDFQRQKCGELWGQFFNKGVIALVPVLMAAGFLVLAGDSLNALYKKTYKKIKNQEVFSLGTVATPVLAPPDYFAWIYCLRVIAVQLKDKRKIRVYLPLETPVPLAGQTMMIIDGGVLLGQKRYLGMVYMPHVAIVAGSKLD